MKVTNVKFKGINYQVTTGDIFQAKLENGVKGQIFIVQCNDDEKVTLEVVDKLSNHIVLLRVNNIEWKEKEVKEKEDYTEVIKESDSVIKSLDDMTKKELIAYANEHELTVDKKATKGKLLEEIKSYYK